MPLLNPGTPVMNDTVESVPEPPPPPPGRTKGMTLAAHAARKRRRRFWINAIAVLFTVLVLLGCGFWIAAFHIYNIGSNSMAPTLLGTAFERDRVLCWMLAYHYRQPRRWEIATFDTPGAAANREIMPGFHTGGESGMTIKRVLGVGGERLAIANGDIWTRPLTGGTFTRRVKPDQIQRSLWIPVYAEDFKDVRLNEFLHYWEESGRGKSVIDEQTLRLIPNGEAFGIVYQPVIRRGGSGGKIEEVLPGIPDRYMLAQEVSILCATPGCGTVFAVVVNSQKVQGRCPVCSQVTFEKGVSFYSFRSGLAEIGPYAAGGINQGDSQHFRANSYYFVPDLRAQLDVMVQDAGSALEIELNQDDKADVLRISADAMTINGRAVSASPIGQGKWTHIEFYRVDGAVRLFVGDSTKPVFDQLLHREAKPDVENTGMTSGLGLTAHGNGASIRNLSIDRDIYYFSGGEHAIYNYLSAMENGEVDVPEGTFLPLGDNTTVSLDGRSWGALDNSSLRGVAVRIWRPLERARFLPIPPQ